MELTKDITAEKLPARPESECGSDESLDHAKSIEKIVSQLNLSEDDMNRLSDEELTGRIEEVLLQRIQDGDEGSLFHLAQLYFENEKYEKALPYFKKAARGGDCQAKFQLGVMYYDGLGTPSDHTRGLDLMRELAESEEREARNLVRAAQYNVGRAYYQGYGVMADYDLAEKFWLLAADDGNPRSSIKAQSILGMFYCIKEHQDLPRAFFWHSEACGNGNLESQGALGMMHLQGLGTKTDEDAAFICLREAAGRGNVYAMGQLVSIYYRRKLFTKAVHLATRVALFEDLDQICRETDCVMAYVRKGISLASFYCGRCLHLGRGVTKDEEQAKAYYSRSFLFDPDICAILQALTQHGAI